MKYGIFKSQCDLMKAPKDGFDVVLQDTEMCSPIEMFDTEEEAVSALHKYEDQTHVQFMKAWATNKTIYRCTVFCVASLEVVDDDDDLNDPNNYCTNEFYATTSIARFFEE